MSKEIERSDQPRGVGWAGRLDLNSNAVTSEAFFKATRVSRIVDTYFSLRGNLRESVKLLNDGVGDNDIAYIKTEDIVAIVDWASRNPIKTVVKL